MSKTIHNHALPAITVNAVQVAYNPEGNTLLQFFFSILDNNGEEVMHEQCRLVLDQDTLQRLTKSLVKVSKIPIGEILDSELKE